MTYTLIHNPNCSTSRKGLALLEEKGISFEVRKYMNPTSQLSVEELKEIARKMGDVSPRAFLRDREKDVSDTAIDEEIYAAMADNPKLIQRPIGVMGDKAVLGRPFENLLDIL